MYVGITINLKLRLYQHMHVTCVNPGKVAWLQGLKAQGLEPEIKILDECPTFEHARDREKYWIHYYAEHGTRLLNVADNPLAAPVIRDFERPTRYFSPNLRSLRKERGFSQQSLAKAVDVQSQTIANYESFKSSPRYDTMRKLCEVLGVPSDQLFLPYEEQAS